MAKSKWEQVKDKLILVECWARDGLTDEQIANNLGINVATLYRYKKEHCEICEALKKGKEVVDYEVENALLKRALGYEYKETTYERIKDTGQNRRHEEVQKLTQQEWEICKAYFNYKCCYCGKMEELTKDHLQPLASHGMLEIDNVVPACQKCNSSKKDKQWSSWYIKNKNFNKERYKKIIEYIQFAGVIKSQNIGEDGGMIITKEVTKQVAPDITAQIFWLKNRKHTKWKDKRENESNSEMNLNNAKEILVKIKEVANNDENN